MRRLLRNLLQNKNKDDGDGDAAPLVVGYEVAPVNMATRQRLSNPQLLSGEAATALHAFLLELHSKQMVRLAVLAMKLVLEY